MVKKTKSKENLWRCTCKSQTTKKTKSLDGVPQTTSEGLKCECRVVSQVEGENTKFGKEVKVDTAIIRTDRPAGGFVLDG